MDTKTDSKPQPQPESARKWGNYLSLFGIVGLLLAVIYVNPLSGSTPSLSEDLSRFVEFFKGVTRRGDSTADLIARYKNGCPNHQFASIKVVSRRPDIMLIEGFVTKEEADFLVKLA